ncbi:MAG: helix-turn-helix domain-containing protein [Clostridia bacterium]|nr:helix-turn-helix domain-containing protein [Clostridia bacterium]
MSEIRENISKNILELRKKNNITQIELAERLNYTDKAVSKWERGESIPDVEILYQMSKMFNVTVDYFFQDPMSIDEKKEYSTKRFTAPKIIQLCLWVMFVWFVGTVIFVYNAIYGKDMTGLWICFVWPLPISFAISVIYCVYYKINYIIPVFLSAGLWSSLSAIYLQCLILNENIWLIFILGIPLQIIIILAYWLKKEN